MPSRLQFHRGFELAVRARSEARHRQPMLEPIWLATELDGIGQDDRVVECDATSDSSGEMVLVGKDMHRLFSPL